MPQVDIVKLRALVREWRLEGAEYRRLATVAESGGSDNRVYLSVAVVVEQKADALEGILGVEVRGERP